MKIKILYEDANILAIDKPSGVLVHPVPEQARHGAGAGKNVFDEMRKKYLKLELVHRLDKETSGVLLLAKNKKAHEFLKSQFAGREVKKIYNAIVSGSVKNDRGIINKPIGRSPADFRRRLSGRGARGEMREAITDYKVLRRFQAKAYQNFYPRGSHAEGEGRRGKNFDTPEQAPFTYLEIKPKTGRTHQIRVHMKYINHPIAGDNLYNPDGPIPLPNLPLRRGRQGGGTSRMMLHASSIEFKNLKGRIIKVESPLPKEFKKVIE